jgi:7-cyano-7-deazaguanine synthase
VTAVLLASGGLDSTTLAYWLIANGEDFAPLFVNYGQHCAARELATLRSVLPPSHRDRVTTIDLSDVYRGTRSRLIDEPDLWDDAITHEDLHLPYRNLLLLTTAAAYAQARSMHAVYAAFINSNHALELDCSAAFFDTLHSVLTAYGSVEVRMPFRFMKKAEVAHIGIRLGAPVAQTFSCQAQSSIPCGACPNCVDRLEALRHIAGGS